MTLRDNLSDNGFTGQNENNLASYFAQRLKLQFLQEHLARRLAQRLKSLGLYKLEGAGPYTSRRDNCIFENRLKLALLFGAKNPNYSQGLGQPKSNKTLSPTRSLKSTKGFGFRPSNAVKPNRILCRAAAEGSSPSSNENTNPNPNSNNNMFILKSPTGSGKTRTILEKSVLEAAKGNIVVICFPNLNLLQENQLALNNYISETYPINLNIKVQEISLAEFGGFASAKVLLNEFQEGRKIFLTLHTYLLQRGDFTNYSLFFKLLQPFQQWTTILIDEAHLFFEAYTSNLQMNFLVRKDIGGYRVIKSGRDLEDAIQKGEEVFLSETGGIVRQIANIGKYLSSPTEGLVGQPFSILDNTVIDSSFTDLPPEIQLPRPRVQNSVLNAQSPEPIALVPQSTNNSLAQDVQEILNKKPSYSLSETSSVLKIFENKDPNRATSLRAQYYNLDLLTLTGDLNEDAKFKSTILETYTKLFNYNAFFSLMSVYDHTEFITLLGAAYNKGTQDYNAQKLTNDLAQFVLNYVKESASKNTTRRNECEGRNPDEFQDMVRNGMNDLLRDFIEILLKSKQHPPEEIHPQSLIEALTYKYALSTTAYFISYNPILVERFQREDGREYKTSTSLRSYSHYVKIVKEIIEKRSQEAKEKAKVAKAAKGAKAANVDQNPTNSSDDEAPLAGIENTVNAPLGNNTQNQSDSLSKRIFYIKGTPFTSELNFSNYGELSLFQNFKEIYWLSATYSTPTVVSMQEYLPQINFFEFDTKRDMLDKLYIIESNIDWYQASDKNGAWKANWDDFATFFMKTFVNKKPVAERKFGLFLLPSNNDVVSFYKYNIKKPDEMFSIVAGSRESYMEGRSGSGFENETLTDERNFSVAPPNVLNRVIRLGSILSTIAVGLNMPEHIFIMTGANTYKPVSALMKYGDIPISVARDYEITLALIQAIGRNARKSPHESANNLYTPRCVLVSKANVSPNVTNNLAEYSKQFYKSVEIINLKDLEEILKTAFRGGEIQKSHNRLLCLFESSHPMAKFYQNEIYPFGVFKFSQDVRFSYLKMLLSNMYVPQFNAKGLLFKHIMLVLRYKTVAIASYMIDLFLTELPAIQKLGKGTSYELKMNKQAINSKFNIDRFDAQEKALIDKISNPFFAKLDGFKANQNFQPLLDEILKYQKNDLFIAAFDFFFAEVFKTELSLDVLFDQYYVDASLTQTNQTAQNDDSNQDNSNQAEGEAESPE